MDNNNLDNNNINTPVTKKPTPSPYVRLLLLIGITVIAVLFAKDILRETVPRLFVWLGWLTPSTDGQKLYILNWIYNDIVAYTAPLLILYFIMKKHIRRETTPAVTHYGDEQFTVFLLFLSLYSLLTLASIFTHRIAEMLTRAFGTGELRDVFENVMPKASPQWWVMLIFVGFTAPVLEEIIFRHFILRPLRHFGNKQAILISAVLFGAFHGNWTQFPYATVAGIVLGIVAVRADSVMPAIALHVCNNTFDLCRSFVLDKIERGEITFWSEGDFGAFLSIVFLAGLVITVVLFGRGEFRVPAGNPSKRIRQQLFTEPPRDDTQQ